jgi:hypothetical protein
MHTIPRVLSGLHINFYRDGTAFTVPSAGTAGRNAKPGASDPGWVYLGKILEGTANPEVEEREVHAAVPGAIRLYDVVEVSRELTLEFTCQELNPLAIEAAFGTQALTAASTQFNPLAGTGIKGWLKVQSYDSYQNLVMTVDLYCHIKLNGGLEFNRDLVNPDFTAQVLWAEPTTGSLTSS